PRRQAADENYSNRGDPRWHCGHGDRGGVLLVFQVLRTGVRAPGREGAPGPAGAGVRRKDVPRREAARPDRGMAPYREDRRRKPARRERGTKTTPEPSSCLVGAAPPHREPCGDPREPPPGLVG